MNPKLVYIYIICGFVAHMCYCSPLIAHVLASLVMEDSWIKSYGAFSWFSNVNYRGPYSSSLAAIKMF